MAVRIVGTFADRLPESLTRNAAARLQEFSAQVGERLVVDDTPPTVYLGLARTRAGRPSAAIER